MEVDVGKQFYHRLANRDQRQGDGKYSAVEFRDKYLKFLDNEEAWRTDKEEIVLDFTNVKKIGPSFANEAFAYFTKYAKPERIFKKIVFKNISQVQRMIIHEELDTGYKIVK